MPEGALPHRPPPCCATSQGRCQWQQSMAARPELGELTEPVPQGLSALHNSKHTLGLQLQPGRTRPRPPHSPELLFLAFLEPAVPQQPASVQSGLPQANSALSGCCASRGPAGTWALRDEHPFSSAAPRGRRADLGTQGCVSTPCCHRADLGTQGCVSTPCCHS